MFVTEEIRNVLNLLIIGIPLVVFATSFIGCVVRDIVEFNEEKRPN